MIRTQDPTIAKRRPTGAREVIERSRDRAAVGSFCKMHSPPCHNNSFMPQIHRALMSVTDKTGIADFARALDRMGVEILSTGGTHKALQAAGIKNLREVADVTGFPEMLDGRVKTIHPRIAGGILAMRAKLDHMAALDAHGIPRIDLVCVNLYAFEKIAAKADATLEDLIENIDIGGPTMIRAAAKNWQDVAVVTSPDDYPAIVEELESNRALSEETHWRLAKQAFSATAAYDRAIALRLAEIPPTGEVLSSVLDIRTPRKFALRYGENPHQSAALYASGSAGIAGAEQLHGRELSYNNLVDLDAAWQLIGEFDEPASAIIKHTNPCGCAQSERLVDAYLRALEADPVSAYGGVLAFNHSVDEETAAEIAKTVCRSDRRARVFGGGSADSGHEEKSADVESDRRGGGNRGQIDQRRVSGPDAGHPSLIQSGDARSKPNAHPPMTNGPRSSSAGRFRST